MATETKAAPAAATDSTAQANQPKTEAENPKIIAPRHTLPTAAQTDGPSLPHPSTDTPPPPATKEEAEALARAKGVEADDPKTGDPRVDLYYGATNVGEPVGDPIQCIVKKKFLDERGALHKPGAVYFFQRREDQTFPADVLEPVNKSVATAVKKEFAEHQAERREEKDLARRRRDAFARLALESGE